MADIQDQIRQLDQVKTLVAQDPSHYPDIVRGILPIANQSNISLRRWCSAFLVDAFTSVSLDIEKKKLLTLDCIDAIISLLNDDDFQIQKSLVTLSSTVYGLGMMVVSQDVSQSVLWDKLTGIKQRVMQLWDSSHFGVKAECIKFAQQVIVLQSFANRDPRIQDRSGEFSLSSVSPNHPLIKSTLEAEAQGLLDRMLSVFTDQVVSSKALTATLYALTNLMKARPVTISKCLKTVLSLNVAQRSIDSTNDKEVEVEGKFIEKALKLFLQHVLKSRMAPKFNSQIEGYLSMLSRSQSKPLKRQASVQITKEEPPKKLKSNITMPQDTSISVPPGSYSFSSLYSLLSKNSPLLQFDVKKIPLDVASNIAIDSLADINLQLLQNSLNIVRARYDNFLSTPRQIQQDPRSLQQIVSTPSSGVSQVATPLEKMQQSNVEPADDDYQSDDDLGLQPSSSFSLPSPTKFTSPERISNINQIATRMISYDKLSAPEPSSVASKKSLNRVAINSWNKDTWIILISRLLARGLEVISVEGKSSVVEEMKTNIRDKIFDYVMTNFREKIDIIIEWLNEEWFGAFNYNRSISSAKEGEDPEKFFPSDDSAYFQYTAKILDNITPFLTKSDRPQFLRLLSDLPALDKKIVLRLKSLCADPERRDLGLGSLL